MLEKGGQYDEEDAVKEDLDQDETLTELQPTKPTAPDGGWGWLCVLGRFYIHFLIFGTKSAFGIIYIELIEYFGANRTYTAWVGSLASGLILLSAPLSGMLTEKYGCRITTIIGSTIAATGFFISWFSQSMLFLCLSYGIITGIGFGLTFIPSAVILLLYFDKKRALASAVGSTGAGIGSMVLPLFYIKLFEVYGWRGSLWILAGLTLNGAVCGALFRPPKYFVMMKQRSRLESKDKSKEEKPKAKEMFSVLKNTRFLLFIIGTFFCNLGYTVPLVHLPDMALQRGVSKNGVGILLAIMGISGVLLRIPVAYISDFPQVNRIFIHASVLLVCGVATLVCPFLYSFVAMAIYSAVQGGFIGIWGSFLSVLVADIVGVKDTNKGFAFVVFFGGVPSLVSSPLAGWMYDSTNNYFASFCFSGITFLIAGLLTMAAFLIGAFKKPLTSSIN